MQIQQIVSVTVTLLEGKLPDSTRLGDVMSTEIANMPSRRCKQLVDFLAGRATLHINLHFCRWRAGMSAPTQVSAYISAETKAEVEAYVKRRGVKKAYLIEEALQHHLQALREIPEDLIIPSRLVLTEKAMAEIAERITREAQPTEALKALFRG